MMRRPQRSALFPYSALDQAPRRHARRARGSSLASGREGAVLRSSSRDRLLGLGVEDRKSTRLNSSHANISYAVFCLKKNIAETTLIVTNLQRTRMNSTHAHI